MESSPTSDTIFKLRIDETARQHLLTMASWAMIIFILALIKYALSIVGYVQLKNQPDYQIGEVYVSAKASNLSGVIITIAIGLLINYFLYQFSAFTKKGINNLSQLDLNMGFRHLRSYFTIIGILVIIFFVFAFLGVVMGSI